jgi:hypothetical protein
MVPVFRGWHLFWLITQSSNMTTTNRQLALEAAVRFTDRARYTTENMLKNAEAIEKWLNRPLPIQSEGGKVLTPAEVEGLKF